MFNMEERKPEVCRLCFLIITDGSFKVIETIEKEMIGIILPELHINLHNYSVMCNKCVNILKKIFNFKSKCFEIEDAIHNYINDENTQVNLEQIIGIDDMDTKSDSDLIKGGKICRTCLEYLDTNLFTPVIMDNMDKDVSLSNMLHQCVPEMDFQLTKNPVLCQVCIKFLEEMFNFIKNYKANEQKVKGCDDDQGAKSVGKIQYTNDVKLEEKVDENVIEENVINSTAKRDDIVYVVSDNEETYPTVQLQKENSFRSKIGSSSSDSNNVLTNKKAENPVPADKAKIAKNTMSELNRREKEKTFDNKLEKSSLNNAPIPYKKENKRRDDTRKTSRIKKRRYNPANTSNDNESDYSEKDDILNDPDFEMEETGKTDDEQSESGSSYTDENEHSSDDATKKTFHCRCCNFNASNLEKHKLLCKNRTTGQLIEKCTNNKKMELNISITGCYNSPVSKTVPSILRRRLLLPKPVPNSATHNEKLVLNEVETTNLIKSAVSKNTDLNRTKTVTDTNKKDKHDNPVLKTAPNMVERRLIFLKPTCNLENSVWQPVTENEQFIVASPMQTVLNTTQTLNSTNLTVVTSTNQNIEIDEIITNQRNQFMPKAAPSSLKTWPILPKPTHKLDTPVLQTTNKNKQCIPRIRVKSVTSKKTKLNPTNFTAANTENKNVNVYTTLTDNCNRPVHKKISNILESPMNLPKLSSNLEISVLQPPNQNEYVIVRNSVASTTLKEMEVNRTKLTTTNNVCLNPHLSHAKIDLNIGELQLFKCSGCEFITRSFSKIESHVITHFKGEYEYRCCQCFKMFQSDSELYYHSRDVHFIFYYQASYWCMKCVKLFDGKSSLQQHYLDCPNKHINMVLFKHVLYNTIYCLFCDFETTNQGDADMHLLNCANKNRILSGIKYV